ncbi:hypothetical protein TrVE_jg10933 [Triparma verrucosa]|uniref:SH3 domain-containing protein n=2 Tax=Triparma TaxID=722752 RepID=A0A9W6ZJ20_9STRA|nr:hypothetical protein TrST_g10165 [Triparma strigata]GMH87092.1 hypothetical protein TrVE_jg10933 [Triparma verrucosa]
MINDALQEENGSPPTSKSFKAPMKPNFPPPAPPKEERDNVNVDRVAIQLKPVQSAPDPNLHVIEDPSIITPGDAVKGKMMTKANLKKAFTFGGRSTLNESQNNTEENEDEEDRKSDLDTWLDEPAAAPPDDDGDAEQHNKNTRIPFYKKMSSGIRSSISSKMSSVQRPSFTLNSNSNSNSAARRASAMFSEFHRRHWLKKSASMPARRNSVSKYIAVHDALEEMVKRKLDKMKLQRALCAKNLTADQKEAVRAFMKAAVTEDGQHIVIEGDKNVCRVMHPFEAQDEWQMSVLAGETVFVRERLKSGWWAVARVDKSTRRILKGKKNSGILPGLCCDWSGKVYTEEVNL